MNAKQKLILLIVALTLMLGLVWAVEAKGLTIQANTPAQSRTMLPDETSQYAGQSLDGLGQDGGGFYHLSRVGWNS